MSYFDNNDGNFPSYHHQNRRQSTSNQLQSNTEFVDYEDDYNNRTNNSMNNHMQDTTQPMANGFLSAPSMPGLMQMQTMDSGLNSQEFNPMFLPPMSMPPQMPGMMPNPGMPGMMPNQPGLNPMLMMPPFMNMPGFGSNNLNQSNNSKSNITDKELEEKNLEIVALKRKTDIFNQELDREVNNSKILEKKCEEYLSQLQRSADIIESLRAKHNLEIDNYENRLQNISDILKDQKEKNYDMEEINQKLNDEIYDAKNRGENENAQKYELKTQTDDLHIKNESLQKDLDMKNTIIDTKDSSIDKQNQEMNILDDKINANKQYINQIEEDNRKKDLDYAKLEVEERGFKNRINELEFRIEDMHKEYDELKNEKNKINWSFGEKSRENDELKNEIFMMKKLIVDIERRDLEINNLKNSKLSEYEQRQWGSSLGDGRRDRGNQERDLNRDFRDQDRNRDRHRDRDMDRDWDDRDKETKNQYHNQNDRREYDMHDGYVVGRHYDHIDQHTPRKEGNIDDFRDYGSPIKNSPGRFNKPSYTQSNNYNQKPEPTPAITPNDRANEQKQKYNNYIDEQKVTYKNKINKQNHTQNNTNIITWNEPTPRIFFVFKKKRKTKQRFTGIWLWA